MAAIIYILAFIAVTGVAAAPSIMARLLRAALVLYAFGIGP